MSEIMVEDVMTKDVVTATPETTFKELVGDLYLHRVSGLPVVDGEGRVVGIVSESDLLRAARDRHHPPGRNLFLEWFIDAGRLAEIERLVEDIRSEDVMTFDVVTVRRETSIGAAGATLLRERIKRLPVVDGEGRLVGIVTGRDLLQPFLRDDEEIHTEAVELTERLLGPSGRVSLSVEEGVVRLAGEIRAGTSVEELVQQLHELDGVVGVENGLTSTDRPTRSREPAVPVPSGHQR